jgi:hypothetical protein
MSTIYGMEAAKEERNELAPRQALHATPTSGTTASTTPKVGAAHELGVQVSVVDKAIEKSQRQGSSTEPLTLGHFDDSQVGSRVRRGTRFPFAVRWYGITSLYGHFRHFIADAIATESVDSRDWMRPETPSATLRHAVRVLGGEPDAANLCRSLGRAVIVDFVSDTGDDRDVSAAVGKMIAAEYKHSDGTALPRGDILLFGGDIAYPVATADEIYRRLVEPWNSAFRKRRHEQDDRKRLLMAVPGNHDWYDGLDGFNRLFRRSVTEELRRERESVGALQAQIRRLREPFSRVVQNPTLGTAIRQLHLDEVGSAIRMIGSVSRHVGALTGGKIKRRRRRLQLHGYTPVQEASYFVLPIADGLDLWGVDRQLSRMDFRQRHFFRMERAQKPEQRLLFAASDPAIAFGEVNPKGDGLLRACRLHFERDDLLYLTGDYHHYERRTIGSSMQVIAGGGGAFLHGARVTPDPLGEPDARFPSKASTRAMLRGVPWNFMIGRAGYLVHAIAALVCTLELTTLRAGSAAYLITTLVATTGMILAMHRIAGRNKKRALAIACAFGTAAGVTPVPLALTLPKYLPALASMPAIVTVYAFLVAFVYGWFLYVAHLLGLEHEQSFTSLSHPGFKHFVRMIIEPDGRVRGVVIGKADPLSDDPASIVDEFVWAPSPTPSVRPSRTPGEMRTHEDSLADL